MRQKFYYDLHEILLTFVSIALRILILSNAYPLIYSRISFLIPGKGYCRTRFIEGLSRFFRRLPLNITHMRFGGSTAGAFFILQEPIQENV